MYLRNKENQGENKMKTLLIERCQDDLRWYANLVGKQVPFLGDTGTEYKSRETEGYIYFVQYEDAKIIDMDKADTKNEN